MSNFKSHPASEDTGTSWNQYPTSCSLSYRCLEIDHGWSAYNRHIDRQYISGLYLHFLKTSYWTFTNTSLGYLYIALHLSHTHTHVCFSSFGVAMKRNWKWVHTHFCNNTGCHMCWLIFNFLPLLRNQIELLIIGKCLSCTFSRALDTCFFSHPSWDWCFGKQRFTFSVDESFCEKHGSVEVCSAAQCLLSLCLHVDDKLIALRPGHSSSLSPAQFAPVCSQRSWMPSEGSTYSGGRWKALLDFWAFANFHEWSSLCWWAFFPINHVVTTWNDWKYPKTV